MTIPVYILGAISLIAQVYLSDRYKRRAVFIIGSCVPVVVGYLICVATSNPQACYAGMFILVLGKLRLYSTNILSPSLTKF
jgi:MFS family permease